MQVRDRGLWLTSYKDVRKYRQSVATPGMFPSGKSYDEISEPDQELATEQICENNNDNNDNGSIDDSETPTSNLEAEVSDLPLERCMRIVPHDQNSGAFFIAVFHKRFPLPGKHSRFSSAGHFSFILMNRILLLFTFGHHFTSISF